MAGGYEYDRVVKPIFDKYPEAREMADKFIEKIEELPLEVESIPLDIYDFDEVFRRTRTLIEREMEDGNPVYLNVSSAPKLALIAMMSAAFFTRDDGRIEVFYVAPEDYLLPKVLKEAEKPSKKSVKKLSSLTEKFGESGIFVGIVKYAKVPEFSIQELSDLDYDILRVIAQNGKVDSIKELVQKVSDLREEEAKRSSIQYRLEKLKKNGLILEKRKTTRIGGNEAWRALRRVELRGKREVRGKTGGTKCSCQRSGG